MRDKGRPFIPHCFVGVTLAVFRVGSSVGSLQINSF